MSARLWAARRSARAPRVETPFTRHVGIDVPVVCGAMYPCSNPELVAAVSEAGGIGVVQPISLTYVHGHELRAGLRLIRELTSKPIGFNAIVEKSSSIYEQRMRRWVDEAIEEGVRFFVTALGNPRWVCDKVHAAGGVVYHDVTDRRWAEKALDQWCDLARSLKIRSVNTFVKMLQRYRYGIINHCDYPIHTGKLEGVNNKIKVIKRKAYGFHDLRYFTLKIYQAFSN